MLLRCESKHVCLVHELAIYARSYHKIPHAGDKKLCTPLSHAWPTPAPMLLCCHMPGQPLRHAWPTPAPMLMVDHTYTQASSRLNPQAPTTPRRALAHPLHPLHLQHLVEHLRMSHRALPMHAGVVTSESPGEHPIAAL
jgi:hypothetical protein